MKLIKSNEYVYISKDRNYHAIKQKDSYVVFDIFGNCLVCKTLKDAEEICDVFKSQVTNA